MQIDDPLYRDAGLVQFYDLVRGFADDGDFCVKLAEQAGSVLDLGCGTGELTVRFVPGRRVVGVDPAAAMLDIARNRTGGDQVLWVEAPAQTVRLEQRFDLIILTGNAFQVFLGDHDQGAVLATIAAHLAPEGRFIFETRNPAGRAWLQWQPESSRSLIVHPQLGEVEAWNEASHDPASGIVTYQTHYQARASGHHWQAESLIRFTPFADLTRRISDAGLVVDQWYGDWTGTPLTAGARSFIPLGRLR